MNDEDERVCCEECGEEVLPADVQEMGDERLCKDCAAASILCYSCESRVLSEDTVVTVDEEYVCDDCAGRHYDRCAHCSDLIVNSETEHLERYDETVCRSCAEDLSYCEHCDQHVCDDDYYGEGYCVDCHGSSQHAEGLEGYGTTHGETFHGDGPLYLGVELEIDEGDPEDIVDDLKSVVPSPSHRYMALKEDSSLSEAGVEIATQPCSLRYHMEEFPWTAVLSVAERHGYKSHDSENSCGLHVHVSKGALSREDEVKIGLFVYSHKPQMIRFARRSSHYADFKPADDHVEEMRENGRNGDRREAVNYQRDDTVEFRLFRGTLKLETLQATLQFCDALCRWVNGVTPEVCASPLGWLDFRGYVTDKPEYAELVAYLRDRSTLAEAREEMEACAS